MYKMFCCFWSNNLEFTGIVCLWSITDTDSVLCASEDCVILQSIRNTSIAPTWQFRLQGLLREHKFTYLLTLSLHIIYNELSSLFLIFILFNFTVQFVFWEELCRLCTEAGLRPMFVFSSICIESSGVSCFLSVPYKSFQVLGEFNARRGDGKVYTKEKLLAKFTRKVNKCARVKLHKDIVSLCDWMKWR